MLLVIRVKNYYVSHAQHGAYEIRLPDFWKFSILKFFVSLFMSRNHETLRGKSRHPRPSREMKFNVSNFARSSPNLIKTPGTTRPSPAYPSRSLPTVSVVIPPACGINGAADFANSVMNSAPYYARGGYMPPIHPSPSTVHYSRPSPPRKTPRRVMMAAMSRYAISAEIIL